MTRLSIVIPTKDRLASLQRLLISIVDQTRKPDEIIIVTASNDTTTIREEVVPLTSIPIEIVATEQSVCIQRNKGIELARGEFIGLCDDDIELPPTYFASLLGYLERGVAGAVSGLILQQSEDGAWNTQYPPANRKDLVWRFFFQHSVWGDISVITERQEQNRFDRMIARFYLHRGNTFTLAGWPLLTQLSEEVSRTSVYGLGASIIRRQWLIDSPYDEVLDDYGIGDNFGVAIGFPDLLPIHILTTVQAVHHRDAANRLDPHVARLRRTIALDYFLKRSSKFSARHRVFLRWSILGLVLSANWQRDWPVASYYFSLLCRLCLLPNPYHRAALRGHTRLQI